MLSFERVYTPGSLNEALGLLQTPGIRPIAAGTDILPAARDGAYAGITLLDLSPLRNGLSYIRFEDDRLKIGALTTHAAIAASPLVLEKAPVLASACGQLGSVQIRNRATLGGNVVHASPAADSVPFLVAAGASVVVQTSDGASEMPVADFLVGPRRTRLPPGGLVTEIIVPVPKGGWRGVYYKVGGRTSLTIAIVSVAVLKSRTTGAWLTAP
jgi:CO/xanthine dehydrogenase FAD-binding subunit